MRENSGNKISYDLRPTKSIERKLILEILKELCPPTESDHYQYIGMGSFFYSDFKLFHKNLFIEKMISIEGDEANFYRNKFNKPYGCIELEPGMTTKVLPELDWKDRHSIVWLDYDGSLDVSIFIDLETVFSNVREKSFFALTIQGELSHYLTKDEPIVKDGTTIGTFKARDDEKFASQFKNYLPAVFEKKDIARKNWPKLIRKMVFQQISKVLSNRNAGETDNSRIIDFKQVLFIAYKDGAPMLTIGFIVDTKDKINKNYNFLSRDYVSTDEHLVELKFPILTKKEKHVLDTYLPCNEEQLKVKLEAEYGKSFIKQEHLDSYSRYYRYYPNYAENLD